MKSTRPIRFLHVLFVLAVLVVPAHGAPSEGAPGSDTPTLEERIRAFKERLEQDRAEIAQLERDMPSASGEDVEVMGTRISEIRLDMLSEFDALCERVLELEADGGDASAARAVLEPLLFEAHDAILEVRQELTERAAALRTSRDEAPAEEQLEISNELAQVEDRIDRAVGLLFENVARIERMGLDADAQRAEAAEVATEMADDAAARIRVLRDRKAQLNDALADEPDSAELKTDIAEVDRRLDRLASSLQARVQELRDTDVPTAEYQTLLVETTGDVASGLLNKDVALTLFDRWRERATDWIVDRGPTLVLRLVLVVLILGLFRILGGLTRRALRRVFASSRVHTSQLLEDTVVSLASRAVFLLGVLVALSQIGVSLGPILAGLGVAGFIVGFALQDTLSNFAAGGMILFYRPFDVGDMVEAAGVFGKVERMSLVSTTLLTIDHQTLIVPNSKIWGDVIRNVTAQKIRRVDLEFGISYSDDIPHAERVLASILSDHPKVLDDPAPMIRVHRLGDSSVDFVVRPWCATADYWDVHWDVTREVKMRFDREGVSIPFPQRDVHLKPSGEGPALAATDARS